MGILDKLHSLTGQAEPVTVTRYEMVTAGGGHYSFNGRAYDSDLVRACIRPKAQAIGRAVAKHIREDPATGNIKVNPDAYMRFLLEEPNPYMTGQLLQEKLAVQLMLNNNAFALIQRDNNGYPIAIYPVPSDSVEALRNSAGDLFLRFLISGKFYTFSYADIIHLRRDFSSDELFGSGGAKALVQLMEVVQTTDQGIIHAIKNSNVIRWLLKFNTSLKPEDIKKQTAQFVSDFLKIDETDGATTGAAATDSKFDAQQVTPSDYVPNAAMMDRTERRVMAYFNTNASIVQSDYTEDQYTAYYEAEIEPVIMQLSGEYTRKLFSRRERGFGNRINFESANLSFASMATKLALVQLVDRGIMTPNEHRAVLNYAPVEGGNQMIRRLDTRPTSE